MPDTEECVVQFCLHCGGVAVAAMLERIPEEDERQIRAGQVGLTQIMTVAQMRALATPACHCHDEEVPDGG